MRARPISACLLIVLTALFFSACIGSAASDDTINIEAQLIWGTNDAKVDSKLKLVGTKMSERLKHSPFKWDHYYECKRETFKVKLNEEKAVTMSKRCQIRVTNLGDSQVKFQLFGNGQLANTVTQALPIGELLITGGDAENSTAWFVILRQVESEQPHK